MHLPDGIIPLDQSIIYWIICIIFIGLFLYKFRSSKDYTHRLILLAFFSATVTICSGISIPTPFGIPVHFFLIPLAVLIMGPYSGIIITFIALLVQALFLGMGGIVSLGANVLVMGIIIPFTVSIFYFIFKDLNDKFAVFLASLASISLASVCQMIIILISGSGNFEILMTTLIPFYILVGILEGLMNVIIISFLGKVKPGILNLDKV